MKKLQVKFENVGRGKASFAAEVADLEFDTLERLVRPHLKSRDISFAVLDDAHRGEVFAGFHKVGSFTWSEIEPRGAK